MKKSEYNFYTQDKNGRTILYNLISGAVIGLNDYYTNLYLNGKQEQWQKDTDFIENMQKGGFIINKDIDEKKEIDRLSLNTRNDNKTISFTIAPTLACNFKCIYCYEEGHRYNTMSEEVIDSTISFIKKKVSKETKHISVAWYGGEPLLAPQIIEKITNEIRKTGMEYNSVIVTNGYFLDEKMAIFLKSMGVNHAQVTLDGPPDIHDKRRVNSSGGENFFRIIKNCKSACKHLSITIRINVDKENMESIDEIFKYLDQYELQGKIAVYIAAVDNSNGTCVSSSCVNDFEFSEIEVDFMKRNFDKGYLCVNLARFNPSICGAVSNNSYVIDPLGNLYKCWNEIGRIENSVGNVWGDVKKEISYRWNSYNPEFYSECKTCKVYPICMGGCPYKNIVNGVKVCNTLKYNLEAMLSIFAQLRKDGKI